MIFLLAMIVMNASWVVLLLLPKNRKNPDLKNLSKISVIIPAYNEELSIKKTVYSVIKADYPI